MTTRKLIETFLISIGLILLLMSVLEPLQGILRMNIYQARDITRAMELSFSNWIYFGPEASGGGFLPGNLYYLLLSVPLKLKLGWKGVWWELNFLTAFSITLMFMYFRHRLGVLAAFSYLFFQLSSDVFFVGLKVFGNPSFLPFFVIFGTVATLESFRPGLSELKQRRLGLGAVIVFALALQIHFTSIFLLAAFFWILLRSEYERKRSLAIFILMICIALIAPYEIWRVLRSLGIAFGAEPQSVEGSSSLSVIYLFRQWMYEFKDLDWQQVFFRLANLLLWPFSIIIIAFWFWIRRSHAAILAKNSKMIFALVGFSFIPCVYYLFANWAVRYAFCFSILFPILLSFCLTDVRNKIEIQMKPWFQFLLALSVLIAYFVARGWPPRFQVSEKQWYILAFIGALGFLGFWRKSRREIFACFGLLLVYSAGTITVSKLCDDASLSRGEATASEFERLADVVRARTGWGYTEAKKHLFFIDVDNELSPESVWPSVRAEKSTILGPDGFLVALKMPFEPEVDSKNLLGWLQDRRLTRSIVSAFAKGDFRIQEIISEGRWRIFAYTFPKDAFRWNQLQNRGLPYRVENPEEFGSDKEYQGEFNDCPQAEAWCRIKIFARQTKSKSNLNLWQVKVSGLVLSQSSEWVIPNWTEGLAGVSFVLNCGRSSYSLEIASNLGFLYDKNIWILNHSILAPFEIQFLDPCLGKTPTDILFKYERAEVASKGKYWKTSGRELRLQRRGHP